jgi:hypothetical protein
MGQVLTNQNLFLKKSEESAMETLNRLFIKLFCHPLCFQKIKLEAGHATQF